MRVYQVAIQFGVLTQTREGDEKKQWYQKRRHIDHAGLEATLRDEVPVRWQRNLVRDLVVLLAVVANGEKHEVSLVKGYETGERVARALKRMGVRGWSRSTR